MSDRIWYSHRTAICYLALLNGEFISLLYDDVCVGPPHRMEAIGIHLATTNKQTHSQHSVCSIVVLFCQWARAHVGHPPPSESVPYVCAARCIIFLVGVWCVICRLLCDQSDRQLCLFAHKACWRVWQPNAVALLKRGQTNTKHPRIFRLLFCCDGPYMARHFYAWQIGVLCPKYMYRTLFAVAAATNNKSQNEWVMWLGGSVLFVRWPIGLLFFVRFLYSMATNGNSWNYRAKREIYAHCRTMAIRIIYEYVFFIHDTRLSKIATQNPELRLLSLIVLHPASHQPNRYEQAKGHTKRCTRIQFNDCHLFVCLADRFVVDAKEM